MSSISNQFITISQNQFNNNTVTDETFLAAAEQGFFYLEFPEGFEGEIQKMVALTNQFYKDSDIKNMKLEGLSGYNDRGNKHQVESLYLEKKYWTQHLTKDQKKLADKMHEMCVSLLKQLLPVFQIKKSDEASLVTGGVSEGEGDIYLTLNHYRPDIENEGLGEHRDFGQVTLLYLDQEGLQVKIKDEWVDLPPKKNHFVVNFGRALEMSINDSRFTAAWHRVQKVSKERISFGIFADNNFKSNMHRLSKDTIQDTGISFSKYIEGCFKALY